MKILQISKFYPPVFGGIESAAWELSEGLRKIGVRVDVLCSNQRAVDSVEVHPDGDEVVRASSWGRVLSTSVAPSMVRHLRRRAGRYDVIHLHMPDPMAGLAFWLIRPEVPLVLHWHSDVIRQRKAMVVYEPLQRWLLERASSIVVTSRAYAADSVPLQEWKDKIAVIPIGVTDNRDPIHAQKAAAIRDRLGHRKLVLAVGRMAYYKGFEVLIEAAASLGNDCAVMIVGGGDLLEHYRGLVERWGLADKVFMPGHVSDTDLPSYFQACDVYCMPSTVRAEAYGLAMIEAMVMGKPIVASDIRGSGVPWVNVDGLTGFNVPVRQPEKLAATLAHLLGDEALRARMGAASRQRYLQEFMAGLMTKRVVDLYGRLLPANDPKVKRVTDQAALDSMPDWALGEHAGVRTGR